MYLRRFKFSKTSDDINRVLGFITRSAWMHIPAYRRLLGVAEAMQHGLRGVDDLWMFPIVSKQSMLHDVPLDDLLHERATLARLVRARTSGYSGLPVSIYMSKTEAAFRSWQVSSAWREWARLPVRVRIADLGSWVAEESGHYFGRRGPASLLRISQGLSNEDQIALLARFKPHVISGPPSALDLLSRGIVRMPFPLRDLKLVASRGEVLFGLVRSNLEEVFGCPVGDFYNCEEVGNVASQCPADPGVFHINTDACLVEIIDGSGRHAASGEEGRVLLTNLFNCTMPLIRYEIGDRGALMSRGSNETCVCGSRRPRMRLLGGRADDYVFLPNGRLVSPRLVGTCVYRAAIDPTLEDRVRWLFRGFQVVQDEMDHMTVRVIPELDSPVDLEGRIERALRDLHSDLRVTVVRVDDLPHEPTGKFRKVICSIDPP